MSSEGDRGRTGPVLFSPDHSQSFVPVEQATADSAPRSPIEAPCHPDSSPFIYPYPDFAYGNHDTFGFTFSQPLPTLPPPNGASYYPQSGVPGINGILHLPAAQTISPPIP